MNIEKMTDAAINAIWSEKDTQLHKSALSPFGLERIRAILAARDAQYAAPSEEEAAGKVIGISDDKKYLVISRCNWLYPQCQEAAAGRRDEGRFAAIGRRDGDIVMKMPEGNFDRQDLITILSATPPAPAQPGEPLDLRGNSALRKQFVKPGTTYPHKFPVTPAQPSPEPSKPEQAEAPSKLDPNESDPLVLWTEIARLQAAIQGPAGFASWQDAATHERILRVRLERATLPPVQPAMGKSLLRPAGSKPTMCYCPPGVCQAPKPQWCIGNRECDQAVAPAATASNPRMLLERLHLNVFAEICHNANIDFELEKFTSYERALEHHYIAHLNMLAEVEASKPVQAEAQPRDKWSQEATVESLQGAIASLSSLRAAIEPRSKGAPSVICDQLTPEQGEWVMEIAEKHGLGWQGGRIGDQSGVDPSVFYANVGDRTAALLSFAAELLNFWAKGTDLRDALREITDDYAERFDLDSPSTNHGIKRVIRQARAVLARHG